ncbi:hypothetical protein SLEP1_g54075 [Rubroshorea leprosula]|uniref:Uncharacterized protein n=1 Tax=Rubroshorea leprosula TaxID=152421 RepID=A0AAV5MBA2_9ROSI|nr:hypothetical protein SLEP1_g54075 [Rubroshorea leprosula]
MIFRYFLVQEPDLEPRNLFPLQELPDLPCSASSPPAALALWGRIARFFLKFPKFQPASSPALPPASLNLESGSLLANSVGGYCSCRDYCSRHCSRVTVHTPRANN